MSRLPATRKRASLLGVGLDHQDGHKRITKGEKFAILGGSQETHERMTETIVKTLEDLQRKGRELEDSEPHEVADLLHKHLPPGKSLPPSQKED